MGPSLTITRQQMCLGSHTHMSSPAALCWVLAPCVSKNAANICVAPASRLGAVFIGLNNPPQR